MPSNAVEVATVSPADFQSLEEKVLRTIELLKVAREAKATAERAAARLREQLTSARKNSIPCEPNSSPCARSAKRYEPE